MLSKKVFLRRQVSKNKPNKFLKIFCILSSITFCAVTFMGIQSHLMHKSSNKQLVSNKALSVFIGDENGNYTISEDGSFPTSGYLLDTDLSTCSNGGILKQNLATLKISLAVDGQESCNLYFKPALTKRVVAVFEGLEEKDMPIGVNVQGLIDGNIYETWTLSKDNDWCWWIGDWPEEMTEFHVQDASLNYSIELIGDAWIITVTPSSSGPDNPPPDNPPPDNPPPES